MLYELRRYEAFGHNQAALHARFADHTTHIFARLGFSQAGYFETVIGDGPDPEWQEVRRRTTEAHGLLVGRTHSSILRPLPFSAQP